MASIANLTLEPRYCPAISFPEDEKAFGRRYLAGARPCVAEERYDPGEVPKRVFLTSGHKAVPHFAPIHHRLGLSPEARALLEEFEPGVHQFLPVEVARPRGRRPVHRLDGRVLDEPYYLLIPQTFLDAVWVERSEVSVTPTVDGPPLVVPYMGSDNIVLRREVVAGHHVWRGRFHLGRHTFFSDALVRAVEERKLRGLEFVHLEEA